MKRRRTPVDDDVLSPRIARVISTVHLRAEDDRGRCGIVGTRDDPQLTEDRTLVDCEECRKRMTKDKKP